MLVQLDFEHDWKTDIRGPIHIQELIVFSIWFNMIREYAWSAANSMLRIIFNLADKVHLGVGKRDPQTELTWDLSPAKLHSIK